MNQETAPRQTTAPQAFTDVSSSLREYIRKEIGFRELILSDVPLLMEDVLNQADEGNLRVAKRALMVAAVFIGTAEAFQAEGKRDVIKHIDAFFKEFEEISEKVVTAQVEAIMGIRIKGDQI